MAYSQNQIPLSKLTQFKQNLDLRALRSSSYEIGKCPSSINNLSKPDVLISSTYNSQHLYTSPVSRNDFPVYTRCTKTKKLDTPTSDTTLDCTEVTMSELIRISSNRERSFSFPSILNRGKFMKNNFDISKDFSLLPKNLDSSQKKHSAIESSNYFPKVKLNNGALVLDEERGNVNAQNE